MLKEHKIEHIDLSLILKLYSDIGKVQHDTDWQKALQQA